MSKVKSFASVTCAVLASMTVAMNSAQAVAVVDQSQLTFNTGVPFDFNWNGITNYPVGQSFTAGLSGTLSNIMLGSNGGIQGGGNTITLEVRDGDGVSGTLLGTKTLAISSIWTPSVGQWVVDMNTQSLGITVHSGHQYTFDIISVTGPGDLAYRGVLGNTGNPYAGGRVYVGAGYGNQPNWDLVFRTSVAAVPEPETYGMLLAGFGLIGLLARRRKTAL